MELLEKTVADIVPVDKAVAAAAKRWQDSLTKPAGSLGRLEDLSIRIAAMKGRIDPAVDPGAVFVMAGDHGVCAEGVSAYPSAVTAQMVANFASGGAAINVLARHAGARVVVTDVGVAGILDPRLPVHHRKIARGTGNIAREAAMSRIDAVRSIETGIGVFEAELAAAGFGMAATGDMGIGNTTPSSAIAAVFTRRSVSKLVGRGTGISDETLAHKIEVIERALALHRPDPADPIGVLAAVGGLEIGALAGVILAGAAHRIPVLIDGYISGAAALLAAAIAPVSKDYMIGTHLSGDAGHRFMLEELGLEPLLDLGLRLGEGTGAALAMQLCSGACKILNEMATFESAGVGGRQ